MDNLNGSYIARDVMTAALPSFGEKPILAAFVDMEDEDGNSTLDFNGHDMKIATDKMDGESERIEYTEQIVGVIPYKNNICLVKDDDSDKEYVSVRGLVYREYTYAADILEKRKSVDVSVELNVKKFSFDAEKKVLSIDEFTFFGVTLLGAHVKPGMAGSHATIQTFEEEQKQEGGTMDLFEKLLTKYNVTAEDVKFEIEGMSDEEMELKFEEVFGISVDASMVISYEISHDDIRCALYNLLKAEDEDIYWYSYIVEVYDGHFVYHTWNDDAGVYFDQKYTVDGDKVAFDGDKVEVFSTFVTAEEKAALELMRNTYEELKQFKEDFDRNELKAKKEAVLDNAKFEILKENEDFVALRNTIDNYSVEEVEEKAKAIFSNFVYNNPAVFAEMQVKSKRKKIGFSEKATEESNRYGNLFND